MGIIFFYSAQPGTVSQETSYWAGTTFGRIFVPGYDDWSPARQLEFAKKIDYPVRKTAHFTEYAILGFFLVGALYKNKIPGQKKGYRNSIAYSWLVATAYAISDETHQVFVPGRDGNIKDVLLDSAGGFTGILIMYFIIYTASKGKEQAYGQDSMHRKST